MEQRRPFWSSSPFANCYYGNLTRRPKKSSLSHGLGTLTNVAWLLLITFFFWASTGTKYHKFKKKCLFVPALSSCHEKATVVLYFGWICTCSWVVHFRVFRLFLWLLTTEFAACSKPPSRDNRRKAPYPRTQQPVRWGWELNLDHAF